MGQLRPRISPAPRLATSTCPSPPQRLRPSAAMGGWYSAARCSPPTPLAPECARRRPAERPVAAGSPRTTRPADPRRRSRPITPCPIASPPLTSLSSPAVPDSPPPAARSGSGVRVRVQHQWPDRAAPRTERAAPPTLIAFATSTGLVAVGAGQASPTIVVYTAAGVETNQYNADGSVADRGLRA